MLKYVLIVVIGGSIGFQVYKKQNEAPAKQKAKSPAIAEKSWKDQAASKTKDLIASVLDEEPEADPMVMCSQGSRQMYMLQSDCLTQGGRVKAGTQIATGNSVQIAGKVEESGEQKK